MLRAVPVLGFDGSNNNGVPDFLPAHRAGYRFGWWKVSEGTYFTDHTWPVVRQKMQAAGIMHGGYHYAAAKNGNPQGQADFFLERLASKPWLLLPFLDLEEQGSEGVGTSALEQWAWEWGQRVKGKLGVNRLILYADGNMLRNRGLDTARLRSLYLLDFAYPAAHVSFPAGWNTAVWQYDWHGAVPGFGGPVDRDQLVAPHTLAGLTVHAHAINRPSVKPRRANPPS